MNLEEREFNNKSNTIMKSNNAETQKQKLPQALYI